MRRLLVGALVLVLLAIMVAGWAMVVAVKDRTQVSGPSYSPSQVQAGLEHHPDKWLGRTIRLDALVMPMPDLCSGAVLKSCGITYNLLDQPSSPPYTGNQGGSSSVLRIQGMTASTITLTLHPIQDPLLTALRKLPGLGRLVPAPHRLLFADSFQVTIRRAPTSLACPQQPCYWAVAPDVMEYEPTRFQGQARTITFWNTGNSPSPTPTSAR